MEIVGEAGVGQVAARRASCSRSPGSWRRWPSRCSTSAAATPYGAVRVALRELAGIAPDASPEEAGRRLAAWVGDVLPDAAPWLPLLAIPVGAEVAATDRGGQPGPGVPPRPAPRGGGPAAGRGPARGVRRAARGPPLGGRGEPRADRRARPRRPRPRTCCCSRLRRPGPSPVVTEPLARIELAGLPPEAVARLAMEAAERPLSDADLAGIVARAAGNPLFARELAEVAVGDGLGRPAAGAPRVPGREPDRPPRPARPAPAPARRGPGPGRGRGPARGGRRGRGGRPGRPRPRAVERARRVRGLGGPVAASGSATTSSATPRTRGCRTRAGTTSTGRSRSPSSAAPATTPTRWRPSSPRTSPRASFPSPRSATPAAPATSPGRSSPTSTRPRCTGGRWPAPGSCASSPRRPSPTSRSRWATSPSSRVATTRRSRPTSGPAGSTAGSASRWTWPATGTRTDRGVGPRGRRRGLPPRADRAQERDRQRADRSLRAPRSAGTGARAG